VSSTAAMVDMHNASTYSDISEAVEVKMVTDVSF
jgi:hypothetical protein